jgi:FtsH-binding integral membrane protein
MRRLHLSVGVLGVLVFLGTGLYMRQHFPEAYAANEALRYIYRANHVYLLLASLVNVALGLNVAAARDGWRSGVATLGSWLALVSPLVLTYAFFFEAPLGRPDRLITALGIFAVALGVVARLVARAERELR